MAIIFTNLGASANPDINSSDDATSYANSSWSPPTSGFLIAYIYNGAAIQADTVAPTISGNNLTWTQIETRLGGTSRITLFAANLSGATAGVTTVDFGSIVQLGVRVSFFRAEGVDLTGGVAAAFVQTVKDGGTSAAPTLTLAAAGHADNRPIVGFYTAINQTATPRTNWTLVDDLALGSPPRALSTQWRADAFDTTASVTWAGSNSYGGIAAELKAVVSVTVHDLTARSIETGAPSLGKPSIAQTHTLGALSVEAGTPELGTPSIEQTHALGALNLETGAPTLGSPSLARALGVQTGAPVLGRPVLTEGVYIPPVRGVETGAPILGRPVLVDLGSTHVLAAQEVETGAPILESPALVDLGAPGVQEVETGAPQLGTPALQQVHTLGAADIVTAAPILGRPAIFSAAVIHELVPLSVQAGAPVLGRPSLLSLAPLSVQAGAPVLGRPSLQSAAVVVVVASQRRYIVPAENRILVIE